MLLYIYSKSKSKVKIKWRPPPPPWLNTLHLKNDPTLCSTSVPVCWRIRRDAYLSTLGASRRDEQLLRRLMCDTLASCRASPGPRGPHNMGGFTPATHRSKLCPEAPPRKPIEQFTCLEFNTDGLFLFQRRSTMTDWGTTGQKLESAYVIGLNCLSISGTPLKRQTHSYKQALNTHSYFHVKQILPNSHCSHCTGGECDDSQPSAQQKTQLISVLIHNVHCSQAFYHCTCLVEKPKVLPHAETNETVNNNKNKNKQQHSEEERLKVHGVILKKMCCHSWHAAHHVKGLEPQGDSLTSTVWRSEPLPFQQPIHLSISFQ